MTRVITVPIHPGFPGWFGFGIDSGTGDITTIRDEGGRAAARIAELKHAHVNVNGIIWLHRTESYPAKLVAHRSLVTRVVTDGRRLQFGRRPRSLLDAEAVTDQAECHQLNGRWPESE